METKTALEISVMKVLEALKSANYCHSTILLYQRVYDLLLKKAVIMQIDTFCDVLSECFVNDSANRKTGLYCYSRKCLHKSCIRKLRECEEKGYVGWMPYVESFKHSLGWKYETSEFYLHNFDRYCAENESEISSLKDNIKSWAAIRETESPNTQHIRVAPIREFGKYLQLSGYFDSSHIIHGDSKEYITHFLSIDSMNFATYRKKSVYFFKKV